MPKEVKEEKVHKGRKSRELDDDGEVSPDDNANEDEVTGDSEEEEVEEKQHAARQVQGRKKRKEKMMR